MCIIGIFFSFAERELEFNHLNCVNLSGSYSVAKIGLELNILLPQLPKCWGYTYVPPYSARILDTVEDALFILSASHFGLLFQVRWVAFLEK